MNAGSSLILEVAVNFLNVLRGDSRGGSWGEGPVLMFKAEVLLLLVQGKSDKLQILSNYMLPLVLAWLGAWRDIRTLDGMLIEWVWGGRNNSVLFSGF